MIVQLCHYRPLLNKDLEDPSLGSMVPHCVIFDSMPALSGGPAEKNYFAGPPDPLVRVQAE